jgi:bifunctional DNase/RNase
MNSNDLVQVYVRSISAKQDNKNFRMIELADAEGKRVMCVIIGTFEADFIAAALDSRYFKRPMPYDVISNLLKAYRIDLKEIIIFSVKENVIYSKLMLEQDTNAQEITIRISDALALAVETGAPIFVERNILNHFFDILQNQADARNNQAFINEMNLDELNEELQYAAEEENYEFAAKIRDEIKKRNENSDIQTKINY